MSERIKKVSFNNKNKQIDLVYVSGKKITLHYGQIKIAQNIERIWVDKETRALSVGIELKDGTIEYMPYDQPLDLAKDPEYLLKNHIEIITAKIKSELNRQRISKRFLAHHLKTSDNQIQRLLNPKIANKNLIQLYLIASLLGLEFNIQLKKVS